jgi:hypothetical protein
MSAVTLENISAQQLEEMKHALGLGRVKKPYRNRFYTEATDANWNDLVDKGLAKKSKGWEEDMAYFHLTIEGARLVYGKRMTKDFYEDL